MKKALKQFTAIFTATVMTFSVLGISVSAESENASAETSAAEAQKYTGWESCETGWLYLKDGVPYVSKYYTDSLRIDGIHYDFSMYGVCIGKYTGWSESGNRYYRDGLPHTGWVEDNAGKQYCLNGYPVTGDFQIGDTVYSFDGKGIYTGESEPAVLTASCDEMISADAKKISITVKYNDGNNNKEYSIGEPAKMERWENGKWKRCGKSAQYDVDDVLYELGGLGDCSVNFTEVPFYPNRYMGGDMPTGYYRITVPCGEGGNYSKTKKNVYAVFKAVPTVEVKMSEDIYLSDGSTDIDFQAFVKVNSEKLEINDISVKIEEKTNSGWETAVEEFKYDKNAACDSVSADGTITVDGSMPAKTGYFRAALNINGKEYTAPFRVAALAPIPWLDEYSLKDNDITVSFTLYNRYEKSVRIRTDLHSLFKKENGKWTDIQDRARRSGIAEADPQYTALEADHKTALTFDLSDLYDTSKLTAGDYAVWIDGVGYAEFRLTDKETKSGEFPFAGIKAEDVKEIQLIMHECGGDHEIKASFKKGEYFDRTLDYLRQLKFEKAYEKYSNDSVGFGGFEVVVRLNSGKKKTLSYRASDAVVYNGGKVYKCNWQVYPALNDFLIEDSGIDKYYYGYRNS